MRTQAWRECAPPFEGVGGRQKGRLTSTGIETTGRLVLFLHVDEAPQQRCEHELARVQPHAEVRVLGIVAETQ